MELWSIPLVGYGSNVSIPIILSLALVLLTIIAKRNGSSTARLPPGPRKIPFLGNIHLLIGYVPQQRLRQLALKYGPLMHLQLGQVPYIIISSPEYAKLVMKTHDSNFATRPHFFVADVVIYNSTDIAFSPLGDYWRQLRRVCASELFGARHVASFQRIREASASELIKSISSRSRGNMTVNLSEMLNSSIYTFTSRVAFGIKCDDQEAFISTAKKILVALGGFNIADIFPSIKLFQCISEMWFGLRKLHRDSDRTLQNIIDKHIAKRETRDGTRQEDEAEDIVDALMNLRESGKLDPPLTMDNIKAIIMDLFVAGSDTSSTVLEWAMAELLKNPRVMKKAQEEVRQVNSTQGNITESEIHQLEYLKLIIKESLRLHPPAPLLLPRETIERCEINGYEIPAKSIVGINAWAIGRDPQSWTEPERFYPERFLESSIDYKGAHFELIPFGSGRRICPGMSFAIPNLELQLAMLLYHFDWELPNGANLEDLDMTEDFGATLRRKNDLHLIPIPYVPSSAC
ncbi:hypothetical protein ACFE04_003651 [Oxalis oulophora]